MIGFYLFCLLPIFIGSIVYTVSKRVHIVEWLIGSALCFLLAGGCHIYAFKSQVYDNEIYSGKVTNARQYSTWKEYYEEAIYRTVTTTNSDGTTSSTIVFSHWEPRTRVHDEYHKIETNIHSDHRISKQKFLELEKKFGNTTVVKGKRKTGEHRSRMIAGDPNDYVTYSHDYIEPIHEARSFTNRLRAAKSVFNFVKVPEGTEVYEYPQVKNIFKSDRVLGKAKNMVDTRKWDEMNARLGVGKNVNVILVGFESDDKMVGEWQRSHWLGGKKNDIVICFGPKWSYVFGWSDADVCKKNLETVLLKNKIDDSILPLIEKELFDNYKKTDWTKFDHLSIDPTGGQWAFLIITMLLTQAGLYVIFHINEINRHD